MKDLQLKISIPVLLAASLVTAGIAHAQTYSQLNPLPGTMEGMPLVNSNNPESVSREGLLLASEPMVSADPGKISRTLSTGTLDTVCSSGGMREFAFYMHHLLAAPSGTDAQVDRVYLLIEPAGASATFNAYGAAISQRDITVPAGQSTLDPGKSPSYSVSLASLTGTLPSWVTSSANGSAFINISGQAITGVFPLAVLRGTQGASLDARIKIRATSGCVKVRVVAASANNNTLALADNLGKRLYAWGNVASTYNASGQQLVFGGAPCSSRQPQNANGSYNWIGWGRSAGVYRYERWAGTNNVSLTGTSQNFGFKFLAAPSNLINTTSTSTATPTGACNPTTADPSPSSNAQRSPALRSYTTNTSNATGGRDSDPWTTANYGAEYLMTHRVSNNSGACITARLQITMYPAQQQCATYSAGAATRHWDGAFKVTQNGVLLPIVRNYVKCNDSPGSTNPNIPATRVPVSTIASKVMTPGEQVTWLVQGFVPGLISAPGAFLVNSAPATCP
jgi:Protein of unknown function (DUF3370)